MGRGKRSGRALGASVSSSAKATSVAKPRRRVLKKGFYKLPPWDREQWAAERKVTETTIRDEDGVLGFVAKCGLERDFSNAAERGVSAIVSGTEFDNAMGTRLWGDDDWQEHTVYLLVKGEPVCEMNLANLCAWASKDFRGSGRKASFATDGSFSYWLMTDAEDLAAFADQRKLRHDWHEPDEQNLGVRIEGKGLGRGGESLNVLFCDLKPHPTRSIEVPGEAVAAANLVDLLTWAVGGKTPTVRIEAGPRLRPSALASRLS